MSDIVWTFVLQPNGKLARYLPLEFAFGETNLSNEAALCLARSIVHTRTYAEIKLRSALEGVTSWDNALRGIRARHGDAVADALIARLSMPVGQPEMVGAA